MTDDQLREAIRICRLMANPYMGNPLCLPIEQTALERLASYAEAQMGRRCENCRHSRLILSRFACFNPALDHIECETDCADFGNTCGAFEPKEDIPNG